MPSKKACYGREPRARCRCARRFLAEPVGRPWRHATARAAGIACAGDDILTEGNTRETARVRSVTCSPGRTCRSTSGRWKRATIPACIVEARPPPAAVGCRCRNSSGQRSRIVVRKARMKPIVSARRLARRPYRRALRPRTCLRALLLVPQAPRAADEGQDAKPRSAAARGGGRSARTCTHRAGSRNAQSPGAKSRRGRRCHGRMADAVDECGSLPMASLASDACSCAPTDRSAWARTVRVGGLCLGGDDLAAT